MRSLSGIRHRRIPDFLKEVAMKMFRTKGSGLIRRGLAWILAAGLMAGALGGCQKKDGEAGGMSGETQQVGQITDSQGSSASADQRAGREEKEPGAVGRYKETQISLPKSVEEQAYVGFLKGQGGNLELYTVKKDETTMKVVDAFRYICLDGVWQCDEDWEGNGILKENGIQFANVAYGLDGKYYVGGTDEDYTYHLFRLEGDGSAAEILEEIFLPKDGNTYGMHPPKFEILEDGRIVVYDFYEVNVYDASGKRMFAMAKDFSGSTGDRRGFCEDGEFVTVFEDQIIRYSLETGKAGETVGFDEIKGSREAVELFGDGNGGIYVVNETGVSHANKGGTLWEVLIDGSLTRLGMRSLYLQKFMEGDQQDFYGVFTGEWEKGIEMFHYQYDPDLASVPPSALTVYSLEDNSTVRQAASLFQSQHGDVRVEVRTAADNDGQVTEEMIQGLNTELLSGKGADVLILDGLSADSYIEKGILMDLSDVVGELERSGDMMDNLLDGFKREDGTVYQVPIRTSFPLLVGEQKALQAYFTLDTMARYQGERPLMRIDNYENMLRKIACLRYEELFETDGAVERDRLIKYLETVKALGDANGSKWTFTEDESEKYFVTNHVAADGITGSFTEYDRGVCDSGIEQMRGYWDLCIPAEVRNRHSESRFMSAGKIYLPKGMAAINRSTANEELAKEFIRCLVSYEVQKEDLMDGYPVNKRALELWVETDRPEYSVGSGYGDYHISGVWPSLEARQEIAGMLEGLTVPVVVDQTIMRMIIEGSREYLEGKATVDQAADGIMRKLSIYMAE